jgi:hypothetical protein
MRPGDPTFLCKSSPLIFTVHFLVTLCMWFLLIYLFLLNVSLQKGIRANNRVRQNSRSVIGFPILRCQWNRGIRSRSFNDTTESASVVSLETWESFTKIFHISDPPPHWNYRIRIFKLLSQITSRIRSQMQNGFGPWVRALGGDCLMKKKPRVKISWHCPFNMVYSNNKDNLKKILLLWGIL